MRGRVSRSHSRAWLECPHPIKPWSLQPCIAVIEIIYYLLLTKKSSEDNPIFIKKLHYCPTSDFSFFFDLRRFFSVFGMGSCSLGSCLTEMVESSFKALKKKFHPTLVAGLKNFFKYLTVCSCSVFILVISDQCFSSWLSTCCFSKVNSVVRLRTWDVWI